MTVPGAMSTDASIAPTPALDCGIGGHESLLRDPSPTAPPPRRRVAGQPTGRVLLLVRGSAVVPAWTLASPAPEQVVRDAARAGHDIEVEAVEQLVGRLPEP